MDLESLQLELKNMIIDTLELEDIAPSDINSDEPLFNDGLGLDSIDALELGVALQKKYGIKLQAESEDTKQHFANINSLAALVSNHGSNRG